MPTRYFNWKLIIVIIIAFAVFAISAFGLRHWQRSTRAERALALGNKAYNEHRWEEAAKDLGRYIAVEKSDISALLKYADAQYNIRPLRINNVKQAESAWRVVLRLEKSNSEATLKLIEIYLQIDTPGEAELIAKRYLENNQNPEIRRMLAMALVRQRKFNEAVAELRSIITKYPQQILAYEMLGQLTEQRPELLPDSPSHWFNQAVKNNPSMALAYISRAGFYLRSKDIPKALTDLEEAEKQDLSDTTVRLRLAKEFINANAFDKAEEHLEAVYIVEPANQSLWQIWSQFALKSQSQEMMVKVAETGLKELSSEPWDFMIIATELFIKCNELDRATDCISELHQKDIAPAHVAFLEGLIADRKGHLFEAIKFWQQSTELGSKSPQIRLILASALSRLGDTQSALRQLRILVSEWPELFDGHLALAKLLAQTRNWAETAEQARIASQISPDNLDANLLLIQAQLQLLATSSAGENTQLLGDIEKRLSFLEKNTNNSFEVKLLQFQFAIQQNNFTASEALLNQLKKSYPSEIRTAMAEVDLFIAREKENEAISKLNDIIEKFPEAIEPVRYLAILLARQDKPQNCEDIINAAINRIEKVSTQQQLCFLLTDLYYQLDQKDKAYKLLTSLNAKFPNDISIKRRLLRFEQVPKNIEKAQQLVNDIKTLEGENGWQWRYEQARIWFASNDFNNRYPQIISLLQENLLTNPDDQASRLLLALAYERAGELQLAVLTYRDALSRSPDDVRIIIPTVAALYKVKEYNQADEILNKASQNNLYNPELQKLQLQSYLRQGQLSSASDILQDLINNDPNNHEACFSLALLRIQQNKFDEAEKLLTKLRTQKPDSLPLTYAQIQLNIRQDKPEDALSLCNEIVSKLNNASAYILRARTYTTLERIDKAIEDLEHATSIEPNNVDVWIARSQFYHSIGRPDIAVADIQHAISLSPNNVQIQKRAIPLLLASGNSNRTKQGRILLNKALESNPEDNELLLFKAHLLLSEGTAPAIENAQQILQKITEDQPKFSDAWALLAETILRQGQSSRAMDIALRGLVHLPNDKRLLLLKARSEATSSPILAIPTLKALRDLEPNDVDIASYLAATYIAANQPQNAVDLLKTQLSSCRGTPNERKINIALAIALHKNGNKEEAQKEFDSLLKSTPDDPNILLAQVKLFKDDQLWAQLNQKVIDWYRKDPTDDNHTLITIARELIATKDSLAQKTAEDILRTMLKNDPDNTEVMSVLAILLQITGRYDESAAFYQKVLTLDADNVIIINNLAWIMCENQGKYQQALELAQKGLEIAPNYVDLIDTRGITYYRLGEIDKAIQDFNTCIELYPATAPTCVASRFHLGRAFAELGQKDKAIEQLNIALDLENQIGGLSTIDRAEVQRLIEELSQGG